MSASYRPVTGLATACLLGAFLYPLLGEGAPGAYFTPQFWLFFLPLAFIVALTYGGALGIPVYLLVAWLGWRSVGVAVLAGAAIAVAPWITLGMAVSGHVEYSRVGDTVIIENGRITVEGILHRIRWFAGIAACGAAGGAVFWAMVIRPDVRDV
jgi:hypothetical protein